MSSQVDINYPVLFALLALGFANGDERWDNDISQWDRFHALWSAAQRYRSRFSFLVFRFSVVSPKGEHGLACPSEVRFGMRTST